jgi:IS4 transposase
MEISVMRHHNTVFHGLLKHVPWGAFDRLVAEHGADARVRKLSTRSQLTALLYGQLSGSASLREIETGLASHSTRLYHLGAREVWRSTLADANRLRSHEVFSGLLAQMMGQLGRSARRPVGEAVRLIDSTGVRLSEMAAAWARFSQGVCGAKAHVIYDPDADTPLYLDVTPAKINDILPARTMPVEPGATYVFDLGYYDFGWWAKLDAAGCRFVTRLKRNTHLSIVEERTLPEEKQDGSAGSQIIHDRVGFLPTRLARQRINPMQDPVREIGVVIEGGKMLRVFTNDLDAPAREIADLYKRRWAIELFFRWVKQTLKIRHFPGASENAVRIQIAVALIAYILLRLAHQTARNIERPLAYARLVRTNLMEKRALDRLLEPPPPTIDQDQNQLIMDLVHA